MYDVCHVCFIIHFERLELKHSRLTVLIFLALILGVLFGHFCPHIAVKMRTFAVIFLRMVKMIIAPLLFATLVTGIAGHGDVKQQIGRAHV